MQLCFLAVWALLYNVRRSVIIYRVGKKVSLLIFAITLSTASQFSQFLAHVHNWKFVTIGCIVSPPNMVCVTTLACKTTTFFSFNFIHCCKKSRFYFKWRVLPCGRLIIAMAADDVTNINFGFKQFMTAVGIYDHGQHFNNVRNSLL